MRLFKILLLAFPVYVTVEECNVDKSRYSLRNNVLLIGQYIPMYLFVVVALVNKVKNMYSPIGYLPDIPKLRV